MDVAMSLNTLVPLSRTSHTRGDIFCKQHSLFSPNGSASNKQPLQRKKLGSSCLVVEAKGKRGMQERQFRRAAPPPLPTVEDDGNPKFVIFIRMANVYLWYPLTLITGGTTAKIMVAAKDNFLGKYIYKDTIARNIAAVVYQDEKKIQTTAIKTHRVLRNCTDFKYGYKLVEGTNLRAALSTSDVVELPAKEELRTVLDKVKDFFGDAKESFGKMTTLDPTSEEPEVQTVEKSKTKP